MSTNIQEWEYKLEVWGGSGWLTRSFEEFLNALGKDGWEVISVAWWGEVPDSKSAAAIVFKRPRS